MDKIWMFCIAKFLWQLKTDFMSAATAKSLQLCLTLCDPRDGSLPGSSVSGILQARTLEWVAISFSNAWEWKVKVKSLSHVRLFETTWTAAHQALPSMGFSRQEYWSGFPFPSPDFMSNFIQFFYILKFTWENSRLYFKLSKNLANAVKNMAGQE